jgi:hypothetical protein
MIKKHSWIPYKRKAKSIELNIKDNDEQTIDFFKLYKGNTRDIKRIVDRIKEKYDFDLNQKEIVNEKKWLEPDMKF